MSRDVRVLLVDASPDEREMYAEWFKLKGYCTLQASTGRDGFRLASELRPDVVITAIRLPGDMDGLSLTAVLKREPETRDLPVIVLTGCALQHERDEASRSGCDRLVIKPCLPHVLTAVVDRVLREHRRSSRTLSLRGGVECRQQNGAVLRGFLPRENPRARN